MFLSKLGCPQRGGNHFPTSNCRIKNPKLHDLSLRRGLQNPCQFAFMFPLFLADLDKKYRNEIEMDKK